MKKTKELIKQWKDSRGESGGHLLNFIVNLARAARLTHSCLREFKDDRFLVEESKRNYIISIASCLETYYRDLFMDVLTKDEKLLQNILKEIKEKLHLAEFHDLFRDGISFAEIAISRFSFQSIEEIDRSMSKLLQDDYLDALDAYEHICVIPSKHEAVAQLKLPEEWRGFFGTIFKTRHALVHDSNTPCEVGSAHMARFETFALSIAQITSCLVARKYATGNAENTDLIFKILTVDGGMPAFLTINDLISDDWEVVDSEAPVANVP